METEPKPAWVEELTAEVRRAGRAAVSARAAAEACEESVERLEAGSAPGQPSEDAAGLLRALLPAFDALDRIVTSARDEPAPSPSWLERLTRPRREAEELNALREAVALLHTQLGGALESCGVEIDRELGGEVDPARHRVVEVRPAGARRSGVVAEVVRPGYRLAGRRIREADVVATG